MSCRRSLQIELSEFLADPRAPAFAAFRAHYPRCPECASEVRAWTELHERLSATHPQPERLARYGLLSPEERAAIDRHLAGCPSCRDELTQLAHFDPQRLAVGGLAVPAGGRLREASAWLGRLLWHPAFAYALVGLLLLPAIYRSLGPGFGAPATAPSPSARGLGVVEEELADLSEEWAPGESKREAPTAAEPRRLADAALRRELAPPELEAGEADRLAPRREEALGKARRAAEPRGAARADRPVEKTGRAVSSLLAGAPLPAPPGVEALASSLRVDPERVAEIELPAGHDLELRIPLPPSVAGGAGALVRVVDASGRRELRERVGVPLPAPDAPGARELGVRVPRGWLASGRYRVELHLAEGSPPARRPLAFSFVVRSAIDRD